MMTSTDSMRESAVICKIYEHGASARLVAMLACSRRTQPLRAARLTVLLVAGTPVILASCGARTGLSPGEPCKEPGSMRPCAGRCGSGQQTCEAGYWQTCVVPRVSRSCRDSCGTGTEACENDTWGGCKVPPVSRPCSNDCGEGSETCASGQWSSCEVAPVAIPCESVCGPGEELCRDGRWLPCNAPLPRPPKLSSVVRDFTDEHPDFEIPTAGNRSEQGLVEFELGADNKPVYAGSSTTSTSGRANFDQWYRDTPDVNLSAPIDLQLEPSQDQPGLFVYDDDTFFPIDGQLSGNQQRSHNYHFTLEASTRFQYVGGEVFRFTGDDDMWVFINRRLAIDLGGIHASLSATVDLDSAAARLGLARGQIYPLHFFFAERHTTQSHFNIETSIAEPGSCP